MHIYIDVTDTVFTKSNTGIQRVVKKTLQYMSSTQSTITVYPVVSYQGRFHEISLTVEEILSLKENSNHTGTQAIHQRLIKKIRNLIARFPNIETAIKTKYIDRKILKRLKPIITNPINPKQGDVLYLCDYLFGQVDVLSAAKNYKLQSSNIVTLFYDLIPITHSELFSGQEFVTKFQQQLPLIADLSKKLITISETSKREFNRIYKDNKIPVEVHLLASEFKSTQPFGSFQHLEPEKTQFLSVGTLEPRKDYITILNALEQVWRKGKNYEFLIIGKDGWGSQQIKRKINELQSNGFPVTWKKNADDDYLTKSYASSTAVICASQAEGYGLPLIEAQQFHKHVIASDIEVFRELRSPNITYFKQGNAESLAEILDEFEPPKYTNIQIQNWQQYTNDILASLTKLK